MWNQLYSKMCIRDSSLGIYLSHVMIRDIFKQRGAHTEKLGVYFLIIILSIVFSIIEAKIRTRFLDKGKI